MTAAQDLELDEVEQHFRTAYGSVSDLSGRVGNVVRRAIDDVLNGFRTGRWDPTKLSSVEKTFIGTRVELRLRPSLGLDDGEVMDVKVCGHEVDIKFTINMYWTIPPEAIGHICLLISANDTKSSFRMGLVRIEENRINIGKNRDKKGTLNKAGRAAVRWLDQHGALPENTLLHLDDAVRTAIMTPRSGQTRINELFRRVQQRIINRETIMVVAQQDDGMKRVRDARAKLEKEGILVLSGDFKDQRQRALELGITVPQSGQFISAADPTFVPTPTTGP